MNTLLSIWWHEFRSDLKWYFSWILGINLYILFAAVIYPGDQALIEFVDLINSEEYFQAFLGQFNVENPGYSFWMALMFPFVSLAMAIFAILLGVKVSARPITDGSGELIHTQPIRRITFILVRFFVGFFVIIIYAIMMSSILAIPITGDAIAQQQLIDLSWWAILFMTSLLTMGMVIGIVAADTGRGNMISLFIIIFFYGIQIIGRVIPAASDLNEYNPLSWYQPDAVLLGQDIPLEPIQYSSIMLVIGILTFSGLFRYRDLIPEAVIELPLISRFRRRSDKGTTSKEDVVVQEKTAKTDRNSIFVFWARPLEKRFPITADFIYSERRVLMILFWVIIMFYPVQLLAFDPNNPEFVETIEGTIETFSTSGIFEVFTYGHDITYNLWLWLIVTQAIGNHWLFFLPFTAHLIRKILKGDMNNETAELYGTLPLNNYNVLFQRMFAVFLELIFVVVQTIGWLVLSETIIGITFNTTWEIIALLAVIPLYWFLITTGLTVGLLIDRGVDIARGSLVVLLLLFFARILIDDVFIPDLLGLYDPVLLITEQTLSVQNYGIIWLSGMAILSSISLFGFSSRFRWFDLENDNDPIPT